jgi:hypothetical protein
VALAGWYLSRPAFGIDTESNMDKDEHDARNAVQLEEDRADLEYFGSINHADIGNADDSPDNNLNCGDPREARTQEEEDEIIRRMALDGVLCVIKGCNRPAVKTHCVVDPRDFTDHETWPTMDLCGQHSAQIEALRAIDAAE